MQHTKLLRELRSISDFIIASYAIDSNPLPHLRKRFPEYTWEFKAKNLSVQDWIDHLACTSDFFWPTTYRINEPFVVANRKEVKLTDPALSICGCLDERFSKSFSHMVFVDLDASQKKARELLERLGAISKP